MSTYWPKWDLNSWEFLYQVSTHVFLPESRQHDSQYENTRPKPKSLHSLLKVSKYNYLQKPSNHPDWSIHLEYASYFLNLNFYWPLYVCNGLACSWMCLVWLRPREVGWRPSLYVCSLSLFFCLLSSKPVLSFYRCFVILIFSLHSVSIDIMTIRLHACCLPGSTLLRSSSQLLFRPLEIWPKPCSCLWLWYP